MQSCKDDEMAREAGIAACSRVGAKLLVSVKTSLWLGSKRYLCQGPSSRWVRNGGLWLVLKISPFGECGFWRNKLVFTHNFWTHYLQDTLLTDIVLNWSFLHSYLIYHVSPFLLGFIYFEDCWVAFMLFGRKGIVKVSFRWYFLFNFYIHFHS